MTLALESSSTFLQSARSDSRYRLCLRLSVYALRAFLFKHPNYIISRFLYYLKSPLSLPKRSTYHARFLIENNKIFNVVSVRHVHYNQSFKYESVVFGWRNSKEILFTLQIDDCFCTGLLHLLKTKTKAFMLTSALRTFCI